MTTPDTTPTPDLWDRLAAPFGADEIELLPKPLSKNAESGMCTRPDREGVRCGKWHALPAVHLPYVGHAGITARLNDVAGADGWSWTFKHVQLPDAYQPALLAAIAAGNMDAVRYVNETYAQPVMRDGGMWIELTIAGITKLGFGDAGGKSGPNATKEAIGDAIRNAAMRFGMGTYLWGKSKKFEAMKQGTVAAAPTPAAEAFAVEAFMKRVEAAMDSSDPERAEGRLRQVWDRYGMETLEAGRVVDPTSGGAMSAAEFMEACLERNGQRAAQRARALDEQWHTRPGAGPVSAQRPAVVSAQAARVAQPAPVSPVVVERAPQAVAAQARVDEGARRAQDAARKALVKMADEVTELLVPTVPRFGDELAEFLWEQQVGALLDADPQAVRRWAFPRREVAVAALREQGRGPEAEAYQEAARAGRIDTAAGLLGVEVAPAGQ